MDQVPVKMEDEATSEPPADDDTALKAAIDASKLHELAQWLDIALAVRESVQKTAEHVHQEEGAAAERTR